jgi:hypothetical protein
MAISSGLGSSALLPAGLGFRNKIINGDFGINQRAFTSTTTDGAYGFDRWRMFASDGTTTYSAQTFTAGNAIPNQEPKNFARLVTSGQTSSTAVSILVQRIEDVRTSAGQQVTVSFWAKAASGTPKVSVEFVQGFGSGGSADVNTYINQVTLSTSWVRYTVTGVPPSISGKTIGSDNGYLALHLWVSGGSTYNSRTGSLGIQSNTFDFWGIQLEQNYQPTPFEQRPIGVELALCQRYYYRAVAGTQYGIMAMGSAQTTTFIVAVVHVPVSFRVVPTSLETSNIICTDGANNITGTLAFFRTTRNTISIGSTCTGATQFRPYFLVESVDGTGYVAASAEL